MTYGRSLVARLGLACVVTVFLAVGAVAAPYAAMVMDARTGEVLHSRNADTRLHPASLTKMMTLYIAFEAVERGEIGLDTKVTISKKAASEVPSKLGLKAGQKIALRYLIRAAAIKSANDAATAIGEAIEGSEAAFARRMNRTAKALGMTRSTFKNAHGLTESGHLSTARDMTILGRRLFYDYPQYYNIFSRETTDAGVANVRNTNRRLLAAYRGADGIKTGYTRAAGYNLVASAERGQERIIATVFGGRSVASRNAQVAELLDMGFNRAPSKVAVRKPPKPDYSGAGGAVAVAAVARSLRPMPRPVAEVPDVVVAALAEEIEQTLAAMVAEPASDPGPEAETEKAADLVAVAPSPLPVPVIQPRARPEAVVLASAPVAAPDIAVEAAVETAAATETEEVVREVVTRLSTSGGRHWGVNVGRFTTRHNAERHLLQTALVEIGTLGQALRKVVRTPQGFDANFVGLSEEQAALVCRRLQARSLTCEAVGPG